MTSCPNCRVGIEVRDFFNFYIVFVFCGSVSAAIWGVESYIAGAVTILSSVIIDSSVIRVEQSEN